MLYLDQPAMAGFSLAGDPQKGVRDQFTGQITLNTTAPLGNWTSREGLFANQDPQATVITTDLSARAVTAFLELWFRKFNAYKRDSVHIWSQS